MNYIIVQPENNLESLPRTQAISNQLYYISVPQDERPNDYVSMYVFNWIKHPNQNLYALVIPDLNYLIYVSPNNNLDELLSLFPEVPQAEKDQLAVYIKSEESNRFPFQNIIPSTATVRDKTYMENNGWFLNEEIIE